MALIRIDFDALQQQVSTLGNLGSSYEGAIQKLRTLTETIISDWEGDASRAYQEKLTQYAQQAQQLTTALDQFRGYAQSAVDGFEAADAECAGKINGSF